MALFWDDIEVGYHSHIGAWELTREELIEVASKWDPQPFHTDEAAAREAVFGGLVASSLHIFAICTRLFFDHADRIQVMAMLSKDKIRLHSPARVGDTLSYQTTCISRTPSSSKPDRGTIVLSDVVKNQDGDEVMTQEVTLMVRRCIVSSA